MFIQLHLLTSYPPSNLNRDDLGRPKSAVMGGAPRLRVSSQSLKRAWRTSKLFEDQLSGALSTRTRRLAMVAHEALLEKGVDEEVAAKAADAIGKVVYGDKFDPKKHAYRAEQLAFVGPTESVALDALIDDVAKTGKAPDEATAKTVISAAHNGADIALFGRMLAKTPEFNVEAAVDVAHAITVHKAVIEDDFFTAVDDLQTRDEDDDAGAGAGFMGETGFGAGLYYLYLCINRDLLVSNLQGNEALADATIGALTDAACRVGPGGKKTSFGSHAYAQYILAERGDALPRSLSVAFLKPVATKAGEPDMLENATRALRDTAANMDRAYGATAEDRYQVDVAGGTGTMTELTGFVAGARAGNWTAAPAVA